MIRHRCIPLLRLLASLNLLIQAECHASRLFANALVNVAWCFRYPPLDGDANAYHLPRAD